MTIKENNNSENQINAAINLVIDRLTGYQEELAVARDYASIILVLEREQKLPKFIEFSEEMAYNHAITSELEKKIDASVQELFSLREEGRKLG